MSPLTPKLSATVHALERLGLALACLAAVLITALVLIEVAARQLLKSSIFVTSEFSGFLMAFLVFVALADVTRERRHLSAEFFVERLAPRTRARLEYGIGLVLGTAYVVVLGWLTFGLAYSSYVDGTRSDGISLIHLYIPQSVVVIGLAMMLLRLVVQLLEGPRWEAPAGPREEI